MLQVELDRVEEELKMEIERNAISEPASHPVFGSDEEDEDGEQDMDGDEDCDDVDPRSHPMNSDNEDGM